MIDTEEAIVTRPAKEPAKRWRAVWFATEPIWVVDEGEHVHVQPGAYVGRTVFPSRDVAESAALANEADADRMWRAAGRGPCPLKFDSVEAAP
ncbi:MAG TPA: hypothetical protein PKY87_14595 [Terricaulis sp.]|nr:hypothetical protein [Terricaulis sp.]